MPVFQPGDRFASHTIRGLIAAGKKAEVYEVVDPEGALRALKILAGRVPLEDSIHARLAQEADAIAAIDDVHVVRFYAAGVADGRVWIRVERVRGQSLRRLLAGEHLLPERAVRLVRQACKGVAAAHAMGILHRDLSPGSILVTDDDDAKVADFASAKLLRMKPAAVGRDPRPGDPPLGPGYGVETTREPLGSALTRSPEYVCTGVAVLESDVYAMGLVLYEALSGAHPMATGPMTDVAICERQVFHEPPPLAALGLGIPGDLSELVERAMSKDPGDRGTMRELAEDLGVALRRLTAWRRAAAAVAIPGRHWSQAVTEPAPPLAGEEPRRVVLPPPAALPEVPTLRSAWLAPAPERTLPILAVDGRSTGAPTTVTGARARPAIPGRRPLALALGTAVTGALAIAGWAMAARLWVTGRPAPGVATPETTVIPAPSGGRPGGGSESRAATSASAPPRSARPPSRVRPAPRP